MLAPAFDAARPRPPATGFFAVRLEDTFEAAVARDFAADFFAPDFLAPDFFADRAVVRADFCVPAAFRLPLAAVFFFFTVRRARGLALPCMPTADSSAATAFPIIRPTLCAASITTESCFFVALLFFTAIHSSMESPVRTRTTIALMRPRGPSCRRCLLTGVTGPTTHTRVVSTSIGPETHEHHS